MCPASLTFGPWAADLDPIERAARLRGLRAVALVYARRQAGFISALARAERDGAALAEAGRLLDAIPPLYRRRMLAAYAQLARPA